MGDVGDSVGLMGLRNGRGIDELLRLGLMAETSVAASDVCGETLCTRGDGQGRSGKEHVAEKSGDEHGGMERRGREGELWWVARLERLKNSDPCLDVFICPGCTELQ